MFQVDRKQQVVIIILAAVILFTAGYRVSRWQGDQYRDPGKAGEIVRDGGGESGREIVVHVSGAVEKPGVYKFTREMRVSDALEKAVPLARADVQGLNLAAPLKDGQKIVVPLKEDSPPAGSQAPQPSAVSPQTGAAVPQTSPAPPQNSVAVPQTGAAVSQAGGAPPMQKAAGGKPPARININRASVQELESLPGVGPGLAQRIVRYRDNNGLFTSEEDIKNVQGIGDKLYDQIKDQITVK